MTFGVAVRVGDVTVRACDVAETVFARGAERARASRVKNRMELDAETGPRVVRQATERVEGDIELGVKEGATLVVDGRGLKVAGHARGLFTGGTLLDRVTPSMRVYKDEILGPVLSCVCVPDLAASCSSSMTMSTATACPAVRTTAKQRLRAAVARRRRPCAVRRSGCHDRRPHNGTTRRVGWVHGLSAGRPGDKMLRLQRPPHEPRQRNPECSAFGTTGVALRT